MARMINKLILRLFATAAFGVFALIAIPLFSKPAHAANLTVNSVNDIVNVDTKCSLREAIINANNDNQSGSSDCLAGSGDDVINFNSNYTIVLNSILPTIQSKITINAINGGSPCPVNNLSNASQFDDNINVILASKGLATDNYDAIKFGAGSSGSKLSGFQFIKFAGDAVNLDTGSQNITLECNYFGGVNPYGFSIGNQNGIKINDGSDHIIQKNIISSNKKSGIVVGSNNSIMNLKIWSNNIGLNKDASVIQGNKEYGIDINAPGSSLISGNIVSGNGNNMANYAGIRISGNNNITLNNNLIGTSSDGLSPKSNIGFGVQILNSNSNYTNQIDSNIISANTLTGIQIDNSQTITNIFNNKIGVNFNSVVFGNQENGLQINNSSNINIGEVSNSNIISGNKLDGINITNSNNNNIVANYIGTNSNLSNNLANKDNGIEINNSTGIIIGGYQTNKSNYLYFNGKYGVQILGENSRVSFLINQTFKNQKTPIHLDQDNVVNFNDHGDGDIGPNNKLNNLNIDYASIFFKYANTSANLAYGVDLEAGNYDVLFYKAPSNENDDNELSTFVGIQNINHSGGKVKYNYNYDGAKTGDKILAVITKNENNLAQYSSEVSKLQVLDWDFDGDNIPNNYDDDDDDDTIPDIIEGGCLIDSDIDNYKDCQDIDSDNDGLLDYFEFTGDWDNDQVPNYLDVDSDGDGKSDNLEAYDTDNNGISNFIWNSAEWDFDGMANIFDNVIRTNPGNATNNPIVSKYIKLDLNNNNLDDFLDNVQP